MHTATVEQTQSIETEAQALHRLAAQAKVKGVKLIINTATNHHFCTSASQPGKLHAVTLYSCDCPGFTRTGRCMHLATVLAAYHRLPPLDDPDGAGVGLSILTPVKEAVVMVAPAPIRSAGRVGRVENPHVVTRPSPWDQTETMELYQADAVEIDGRLHRVGDRVRYAYRKGEPATTLGTISAIYRTTPDGHRWKVTFRENDFGRYVSDVRAIEGEEMRHAA